jgi:hypothetical protein
MGTSGSAFFPDRKEILVIGFGFCAIAGDDVGAAHLQVGERFQHAVPDHIDVVPAD